MAVSRAKGGQVLRTEEYLLLACNFRRKKGVSFVKKATAERTWDDVMPRVAYVRNHVCVFQRQVIKNSSKKEKQKGTTGYQEAQEKQRRVRKQLEESQRQYQQSYGHVEDDVLTPKHDTSHIPSHQKFVYQASARGAGRAGSAIGEEMKKERERI